MKLDIVVVIGGGVVFLFAHVHLSRNIRGDDLNLRNSPPEGIVEAMHTYIAGRETRGGDVARPSFSRIFRDQLKKGPTLSRLMSYFVSPFPLSLVESTTYDHRRYGHSVKVRLL